MVKLKMGTCYNLHNSPVQSDDPHNTGEGGAGLVEIVIILPILFSLFFLLFHYPQYLNVTHSLRTSMASGMRLAVTRGNSELIGMNMIEPIHTFHAAGGTATCKDALICYGPNSQGFSEDEPDGHNIIDSFDDLGVEGDLSLVPSTYLYALFYTIQTLDRLVGGVSHPCNPSVAGGGGCLACEFEKHESSEELLPNRFVMNCRFRPRSAFYEIGNRLGGGGSDFGVYRVRLTAPPQ